jgi:HD-like signal output (HDOD) protein
MAHAMTLEGWLALLRPGETPIFRHTKQALLALSDRIDDLSAREPAGLVLADPLASLRLIYLANNRTSRHFANEVATVEHAIMMQGIGVFMDKVRDFPVLEDTPLARDPESLGSLYRLLRLAHHAAWQARDFAVQHADIRAEEVQVATLLYYAPEFLFWLDAPDIARQLARLRRVKETAEAEAEALGFPLSPLRLMLLEAWKIPELTRDLLDEKYAERSRQTILRACLGIAHHSRNGWWDEHLLRDYQALAAVENRPVETIIATAHVNAVHAARYGAWIPAPAAATWLPMLPGPWPQEKVEETGNERGATPPVAQAAAPAPKPAARPAAPAAPAASVAEKPGCLKPDQDALRECLEGIESHLDGSLNLNQMLALVLKGLHHGVGLSRIVFAMVTPDGLRVKSRFTMGVPGGDPLRHFEFDLHSRDLFGQLLTKMQGVWVSGENKARLWPMVSPKLQAMIGEAEFYAMSLFAGGKPFGLIYADRGHAGCELDGASYADFKMLCLQAAKGLGKIKAG